MSGGQGSEKRTTKKENLKAGTGQVKEGMTECQMRRQRLKTAFSNKVSFAYLDVNNFKEVIWRGQISIDRGKNTKQEGEINYFKEG